MNRIKQTIIALAIGLSLANCGDDFLDTTSSDQMDREILAKQLNISQQQMTYVTHSEAGEGLIFYGNVILPFIVPVSYTHLDVYKRQECKWATNTVVHLLENREYTGCLVTVSYTHLDVYKRQRSIL